ncbi:MAG TPA: sigma factor-like helix-turn-helix DNA-binding protein [Kineosporiaceae bacterium]|nr:sigma factor-like helix-turn-helix DNA-binding protein [Kineosporiaceae bacterium]
MIADRRGPATGPRFEEPTGPRFEEFVAARGEAVLRFAYLLTGDATTASALVRQALARTQRDWSRVCRADHPEAYARRLVVARYVGSRHRAPAAPPLSDPGAASSRPGEPPTGRARIWPALAGLPPRQRAVLVLRYHQDLSDPEIAALLGCTHARVHATFSQAFDALRDLPHPERLLRPALLDRQAQAPAAADLLPAVHRLRTAQRRRTLTSVGLVALAGATAVAGLQALPGGHPAGRTGSAVLPGVQTVADCPGLLPPQGFPVPTPGDTPMNEPQAMALAQAIGDQGRHAFADVYGTVIVDQPYGRVALCVTDLARGHALARAAKAAVPGIDLSRLDLFRSRYSEREVLAAMDRVLGRSAPYPHPVYTLSPVNDVSGLTVTTDAAGARSERFRSELLTITGGVPVTLVAGEPSRIGPGHPDLDPRAPVATPAPAAEAPPTSHPAAPAPETADTSTSTATASATTRTRPVPPTHTPAGHTLPTD